MSLTRIRAEQISNIDFKQAVRALELNNITLSGGTPRTVDGVNLNIKDRVLVAGQTTASQNGLYTVTVVGSGNNGTWVRTSDSNATGEINAGMIVMITEGVEWADTSWKLVTDDPIVIGTTGLTFLQNTGNSFSIINVVGSANVVANGVSSTVSFASGNNISIVGDDAADIVTFNVSNNPNFSGNVTGNNVFSTGVISAVGNIFGGGIRSTSGPTAPVNPSVGDFWYNTTTNAQYRYTFDGTDYFWLDDYGSTIGIDGSFSSVTNGTSNITIANTNSNAAVSINGTSNVVIFATTGEYVNGIISASGNITGGNLLTAGLVSSVGNVYGNYFNGTATSAEYADLAEIYAADFIYDSGTVVIFGGTSEITASSISHDRRIAGVISTNPAYLMNSGISGINVALTGRIPCKVVGIISKGDLLVASDLSGVATSLDDNRYKPGCIIGKSLEDYNSNDVGIIEIAVGRF
jgi:hypothetical protein